jgi:hypothetical protein
MQVALLEEISGMANGVIIQLTEDVVTELLVERKRLKIESITMRVETTATTRLVLRCAHETPTEAASPESVRNPELFDEQPVPGRVAEESSDNLSVAT